MFSDWKRKPTNTEIVVSKLIELGLDLDTPKESVDIYRVQSKVTGCESRRALCYLGRRGCSDISGNIEGRSYEGIDLLDSVAVLAKSKIEVILKPHSDSYLWVCIKK